MSGAVAAPPESAAHRGAAHRDAAAAAGVPRAAL